MKEWAYAGFSFDFALAFMLAISKTKEYFIWLTPPSSIGSITVADVVKAHSTQLHIMLVRLWATEVWEAWFEHHPAIHDWVRQLN